MPTPVLMPQLGESVDDGTISKWLKAPGDPVEEFEPLVEVTTDKVDTEIASPASGRLLSILAVEGQTVTAGTTLALIGEPGESAEVVQAPANVASSLEPPVPEPVKLIDSAMPMRKTELGFISPVVAKIAAEHQVDLALVQGSGLGGRITKKDILAYIASGEVQVQAAPALIAQASPGRPVRQTTAVVGSGLDSYLVPHSKVRRSIAEHMILSKHTSAHVTTVMEADMSRVIAHREQNKAAFAKDGVNLTFTAYFISAIVSGLKAYPIVNSSWSDEGLFIHRQINIGMATSLGDEGLIVPVIKHADGLSLLGMARAVNDLATRARARKLLPDEVQSGTFTLTNHGISGSLFASPIINQPQCGILGTGIIQKRAVVISDPSLGDVIAIRPMIYISLTFDHRILDGASADYFLAKVVETVNNF